MAVYAASVAPAAPAAQERVERPASLIARERGESPAIPREFSVELEKMGYDLRLRRVGG